MGAPTRQLHTWPLEKTNPRPRRTDSLWFTAEDFELVPCNLRCELVKGKIRKKSPAGEKHGEVTMNFAALVGYHVLNQDLGKVFAAETGFRISTNPDTVLAPDFAFISTARSREQSEKSYSQVVPELVLETTSPFDTRKEVSNKVARWLGVGVKVVVVLDPSSKQLILHRQEQAAQVLNRDDVFSAEDILPGFTLPIRRLFRDVADGNKEHS